MSWGIVSDISDQSQRSKVFSPPKLNNRRAVGVGNRLPASAVFSYSTHMQSSDVVKLIKQRLEELRAEKITETVRLKFDFPTKEEAMKFFEEAAGPNPERKVRNVYDRRHFISNDGHLVSFCQSSTRLIKPKKTRAKLLLQTFVPLGFYDDAATVCFRDGNTDNVHLDNLYWGNLKR